MKTLDESKYEGKTNDRRFDDDNLSNDLYGVVRSIY